MASDVSVVEVKPARLEGATLIEGLPDVGLVGAIASAHLVETLGLEEMGYVESRLFLPIMVLHGGIVGEPLRIFHGRGIVVVSSETVIPPYALRPVAQTLADWMVEKKIANLISLTGLPTQERLEIETPSVYGAANSEKALKILKDSGIEAMEEGFVAGFYALLLRECAKRELPGLALLSQSFPTYPDPGAAAAVLEALSKILKLELEVKPLLEKSDMIRLKARDLMRQAQSSMGEMGKASEQQIPLMYR